MRISWLYLLLALGLPVASGCTPVLERPLRLEPEHPHDTMADRAACLDYAQRNGVINLGPMMGDSAQNQPDRQQRDRLFLRCMQEKGYRF
jgi:hypothetical protein